MGENEIGGIGRLGGYGDRSLPEERPHADPGRGKLRAPTGDPARDHVELTAPALAALALLRQRVHVHTRRQLGLPPSEPAARLSDLAHGDPAAFVGRVLAEQVQLAKRRREVWPARRIDAALTEAMSLAVAETLEILHDSGQLDELTWRVVSAALAAWSDKVVRAGGTA